MVLRQKNGKEKGEVKIAPPMVQSARESGEMLGELLAEEEVCDRIFRKEIVEGANAGDLEINHCVFNGVTFSGCQFRGAQVSDVRFENCDLSNVSFFESSFYRVEFVACKLLGTKYWRVLFSCLWQ